MASSRLNCIICTNSLNPHKDACELGTTNTPFSHMKPRSQRSWSTPKDTWLKIKICQTLAHRTFFPEERCFTMLCWFLLCNNVNHVSITYISSLLRLPATHSLPLSPQEHELSSLCHPAAVLFYMAVCIISNQTFSTHPTFSHHHTITKSTKLEFLTTVPQLPLEAVEGTIRSPVLER